MLQVRDPSNHGYYYEFPPRFGDMIFFPVRPFKSGGAFASIIVDMPDECCRGEWWGIVVYIASERPRPFTAYLRWSFEASHPEAGTSIYFSLRAKEKRFKGGLLTTIMTHNFIYIQQHRRRHHKTSASKPFWRHPKPDLIENSRLRFEVSARRNKIREYGYRVLCKEDFRSEASIKSHKKIEPNFGESSSPSRQLKFRESGSPSKETNFGESGSPSNSATIELW